MFVICSLMFPCYISVDFADFCVRFCGGVRRTLSAGTRWTRRTGGRRAAGPTRRSAGRSTRTSWRPGVLAHPGSHNQSLAFVHRWCRSLNFRCTEPRNSQLSQVRLNRSRTHRSWRGQAAFTSTIQLGSNTLTGLRRPFALTSDTRSARLAVQQAS